MGRLFRITIIFFAVVLSNWAVDSLTGYSLIGSDLFVILLAGFLVLFLFVYVWKI